MYRILLLTCLCLVAAAPATQPDGKGEYDKLLAWHRKTIVDVYKASPPDPAWDAKGTALLEAAAEYAARQAFDIDSPDPTPAFKAAAACANCPDPMVRYYAQLHQRVLAHNRLLKTAEDLRDTDLSAFHKMNALVQGAAFKAAAGTNDRDKVVQDYLGKAIRYLPDLKKETDVPPRYIVDMLASLLDSMALANANRDEVWKLVDGDLELPEESLIRLNLKARRYSHEGASDADLKLAAKTCERAYELFPNDAMAPTLMITLARRQNQSSTELDKWFDRAIKADPVSVRPYRAKLRFLSPYWSGTEELQRQFVHECVAGQRWDTRIPWIAADYINQSYRDPHGAIVQMKALADDALWADAAAMYEGYLALKPDDAYLRTRYARVAWFAGRWQVAQAQFDKLGDRASGQVFDDVDVIRLVKLELAMRAKQPDLLKDSNAVRSKARRAAVARYREWFGQSYLKAGKTDSKWDADVATGLEAIAVHLGDSPDRQRNEPDVAFASFKKAIAAGCDDPLVKFLAGMLADETFDVRNDQHKSAAFEAVPAMHASNYPAVTKFIVLSRGTTDRIGFDSNLTDADRKACRDWQDKALELLPAVFKDDIATVEAFMLERVQWISENYINKLGDGPDATYDRVAKVLKDAGAGETFIRQYRTQYLMAQAWREWPAKRKSFAAALTGQDVAQYVTRNTEAEKILEQLWQENPADPFAATQLITMAFYLQKPTQWMDFWYRQAMAADLEQMQAPMNKFQYCDPRYMGDIPNRTFDDQLTFGRSCFDSGRYSSGLPLIRVEAWKNWASWSPGGKPPKDEPDGKKLAEEVPWYDTSHLTERYLKAHPLDYEKRSEYAKLACLAEQWREANEQFKVLGGNVRLKTFGSQERLDEFKAKAAKLGGGRN